MASSDMFFSLLVFLVPSPLALRKDIAGEESCFIVIYLYFTLAFVVWSFIGGLLTRRPDEFTARLPPGLRIYSIETKAYSTSQLRELKHRHFRATDGNWNTEQKSLHILFKTVAFCFLWVLSCLFHRRSNISVFNSEYVIVTRRSVTKTTQWR